LVFTKMRQSRPVSEKVYGRPVVTSFKEGDEVNYIATLTAVVTPETLNAWPDHQAFSTAAAVSRTIALMAFTGICAVEPHRPGNG
jgi:hypothetical protein